MTILKIRTLDPRTDVFDSSFMGENSHLEAKTNGWIWILEKCLECVQWIWMLGKPWWWLPERPEFFFLSESLGRTAGDEKLSDQFGASARTANQRRRGHLGDPEASVNHQVPHGYFKDSRYETLVVDLWLQELYRNFALSDFQICFFPWLEGGRVAVARIRRGFSEWFDMLTLLWMLRPH